MQGLFGWLRVIRSEREDEENKLKMVMLSICCNALTLWRALRQMDVYLCPWQAGKNHGKYWPDVTFAIDEWKLLAARLFTFGRDWTGYICLVCWRGPGRLLSAHPATSLIAVNLQELSPCNDRLCRQLACSHFIQ